MKREQHGATLHGKKTPEYRAWQQMKARCYAKNREQYKDWGGRGIVVCAARESSPAPAPSQARAKHLPLREVRARVVRLPGIKTTNPEL